MISWFEKHYILSWAITIIGAIAIFYISSLTFEGEPGKGTNIQAILYHLLAFFFFSFFLFISMIKGKNKNLIAIAFFIAVFYGISDEIHQLYVPGRYGSLSDIFLDSIGIIFALMIYSISILYREKIKKVNTLNS